MIQVDIYIARDLKHLLYLLTMI